jgi:hypothetical protein
MKPLARKLLWMLKANRPGRHNELKHALWMFIHDNQTRKEV